MSSNLKVNSLVPATGTAIGIGTTGGTIDIRCPATFGGNVTIGGTLTYDEVINIDSIGIVTARAGVKIPDSQGLTLGTDNDIVIKHQSGNFQITNNTGNTYFDANGQLLLRNNQGGSNKELLVGWVGVDLKYDNSTKLSTTNTGAVVTGILTATSFKNADGSDVGADLTSVDSNIVPDSDNARTIGSTSNHFVNVFTRRVEGPDSNYINLTTNGEIQVVAKSGQALALKGGTHSRGIEIVNAGVIPSHSAVELGTNGNPWNKVVAQTFHGDGSNLTSLPAQVTIANNADNRIITGGTGVNLNGESNLTFDGNNLAMNGTGVFTLTRNSRTLTLEGNYGNEGHPAIKTSSGHDLRIFTSGNNERMRIDSGGKLWVDRTHASATTGNHPALDLDTYANGTAGATFATGIDFRVAGVHKKRLAVTNENSSAGTGDWIFYRDQGNNEALRITSAGLVGINEISPSNQLHVAGTTGTSAGGLLRLDATTGDNFILFDNTHDSTEWALGNDSATRDKFDIWFNDGSSYDLKLRLNCSSGKGQLDLGGGMGRDFTHLFDMHPLTNPAGALFNYNKNNIYLSQNIFFTGQWQLDEAAAGSYFHQSGGGFTFNTAPSGSANAATSVYKILGIEPNEISTGLNYGNRPSYKGNLVLFGDSHTTKNGGIEFHTSGGGGAGYGSRITANSGGDLRFLNRSNNSAWTETINIGAGHIQFGISPDSTLWDSNNNEQGWYYRRAEGSMAMATRSSTGYCNFYMNKNTTGGTSDNRWIDFYWNNSSRDKIWYNSGNVAFGGYSDYRLKENIVEINDGIATVKQLKPSYYNWKKGVGRDDVSDIRQDGFIAHELQSVLPNLVDGTKDQVVTQEQVDAGTQPEESPVGTPIYQSIDYQRITPILTAAIKELITKVETLEAKVAANEAKVAANEAGDTTYNAKIDKIIDYFKL